MAKTPPKKPAADGAKKLDWMRWFELAFQAEMKVRRMGKLSRLLYRCLLQAAWTSADPPYLPATDADLEFMSDAPSAADWQRCKAQVLAMFKQTEDGRYYHPKSLAEYQRAKQIQGQNSEGARIANSKRWGRNGSNGHAQSSIYDPTEDVRKTRERECR